MGGVSAPRVSWQQCRAVRRDEMRLKQLLGVGLALPLLSAIAAADSQLTEISVQSNENAATIIIRANGALAHNEYRPVNNLLLVDFPGATPGTLDSSAHPVSVPGVTSYQVHSYKAANGTDIARVELTLAPHADVRLATESNAVLVTVTTEKTTAAPSRNESKPSPAAVSAPVSPAHTAARATSIEYGSQTKLVHVRGVSVVRGRDGTNVEIRTTGLVTPKILSLKSPDRLVVDLPNALPESRPHDIPVHAADLNRVRMARYQSEPPITRVVLDLKAPRDYQFASTTDKVVVKLRPLADVGDAQTKAAMAARVRSDVAVSRATVSPAISNAANAGLTAAAKEPARDFVFVEPQYHAVTRSKAVQQDQTAS